MSKWNSDPSNEVPSLKLWLTSDDIGAHKAVDSLYSIFLHANSDKSRKSLVYRQAILVLLLNFATRRNSQGKLITKKIISFFSYMAIWMKLFVDIAQVNLIAGD